MNDASPSPAQPVPLSFSHVGIYARDLEKLVAFYTRVLGFTMTDRGTIAAGEIVFLSWDARDHHQLVLIGGRKAPLDVTPINQLSFRVPGLEDLQSVWRTVSAEPEVSSMRPIDHGNAWSVYFCDPELNRIEIFCDTPWYVAQPCGEPLDLSLPAAEIRRRTEAFCRNAPTFQPVEEWRAGVAQRIARHVR
jgi:catechol 2,3-dioxygenase